MIGNNTNLSGFSARMSTEAILFVWGPGSIKFVANVQARPSIKKQMDAKAALDAALRGLQHNRSTLRPRMALQSLGLPAGLVAYESENHGSVVWAFIAAYSGAFRHISLSDRTVTLQALLDADFPTDLTGLCDALDVDALVFLTCKSPTGLKGPVRLSTGLRGKDCIVLLSDGNGLLWLPVAFDGQFVVNADTAVGLAALASIGPCADYKPGAPVLYNNGLWRVQKVLGPSTFLIEDSYDFSRQATVRASELAASVAEPAHSEAMLQNRATEIQRRLTRTVSDYVAVKYSVYRFADFLRDSAQEMLLSTETYLK